LKFLTGATILYRSANEREFRRYGNRLAFQAGGPHDRA
jgi:hypothetical protein